MTQTHRQVLVYLLLLLLTFSIVTPLYFKVRREWILFHEGEVAYHKKDYPEAISLFKEAMRGGVETRDIYLHLGDAYTAAGTFPEAVALYRGYLEKYPDDDAVRLRYARVLSYSGDFENSTKEYKQVMKEKE